MADVKPLKLEYDGNGTPSGIGEFTSGDTIETAIVDLALPGLTDVNSSLSPTTGDSLVYTGATWSTSAVTHPTLSLPDLTDVSSTMSPTSGDSLVYTGSTWSASSVTHPATPDPLTIGTLYINTALSAAPSSITVSSCPVPPPWSFVEVTADDGENTGDPYYFASGSSQSTTEIDANHITWDSTESYFTLANAGWYEFEMQGSIVVGSSPTDVTTSIVQTDGLGGIEVEKIDKLQRIRTNIDPHDIMIKWVGYCAADNYTCKLDGDNTVLMNKGSTFTCKRIN